VLGRARGNRAVLDAPEALPSAAGDIVQIDVWSDGPGAAAQPIRIHFRRSGSGWTLIGLDRRITSERSVGTRAPERSRR
jgi:hypothetical protein